MAMVPIIGEDFMRMILVLGLLLTACTDADERYDVGYDDGYAEGYNTTCQIRATLIEGNWSNADYSRGYADGRADGAHECAASRR